MSQWQFAAFHDDDAAEPVPLIVPELLDNDRSMQHLAFGGGRCCGNGCSSMSPEIFLPESDFPLGRSSVTAAAQGNDEQSSVVKFKVAVLEDDAELREEILVPQLRQFGFDAKGFETAEELFRAMETVLFDLLVLDINLPDVDGFTVARTLREKAAVGIVVLTGRLAVSDQVKGLSEAADAWLVKPVDAEVLAATLHSLARRMQKSTAESNAGSRWSLTADGWRLRAPNGCSMSLNDAERRLLARLLEANGKLVAHDELIGILVMAEEDVDQHRLEMLIHRLRRKASAEFGNALPLRSVRGRGYVFFDDEEQLAER
jgi:two-component system response regulator PhoP